MSMELGWCGDMWTPLAGPGLGRGAGGAVVASYHTNLPTWVTFSILPKSTTSEFNRAIFICRYATLFGMPWLEPVS